MRTVLRFWCVLLLTGLGSAWAAEYQVIDLGSLVVPRDLRGSGDPLEDVGLYPEAISADGTIVGWKPHPRDPLQWHVAFIRYPDGRQVRLGNFQGDVTHPTSISGNYIVGVAGSGACYWRCSRPFVWTAIQGFQLLPLPSGNDRGEVFAVNAQGTMAGNSGWPATTPLVWLGNNPLLLNGAGSGQAVNSSGVVVGVSDNHATRWTSAGATRLDRASTLSSSALAINDNGTITGSFETAEGTTQAFVWLTDGGFVPLPLAPGDLESEGVGVRGDGVVFGNSWNDFAARIVRWQPRQGQIAVDDLQTLIDAPGWDLESLVAVNASGAAVGFGKLNGVSHAFLLQPLLPSVAALAGP